MSTLCIIDLIKPRLKLRLSLFVKNNSYTLVHHGPNQHNEGGGCRGGWKKEDAKKEDAKKEEAEEEEEDGIKEED